jgi:SAM-dependent methyltransferase
VVSFVCNICGAHNQVEHFVTEPATCACGSNVRLRALIHLLSMELFGRSLELPAFPRLKAIRGLGISDQGCYSELLAEKFDYTNTFYDTEPRLDLTEPHPELAGSYDFILAADVLEHIAPPIESALEAICRLLKPTGFFGVTIFCNAADQMREHFPELHDFRLVRLNGSIVLVNRRRDGGVELRDDLVFHGGPGSTLEMREFGITALKCKLLSAGFSDVRFLTNDIPEKGIIFDQDVSQPLVAAKGPFVMSPNAVSQLVGEWESARDSVQHAQARAANLTQQISMASDSRWLKLGRSLGLGPKFE